MLEIKCRWVGKTKMVSLNLSRISIFADINVSLFNGQNHCNFLHTVAPPFKNLHSGHLSGNYIHSVPLSEISSTVGTGRELYIVCTSLRTSTVVPALGNLKVSFTLEKPPEALLCKNPQWALLCKILQGKFPIFLRAFPPHWVLLREIHCGLGKRHPLWFSIWETRDFYEFFTVRPV